MGPTYFSPRKRERPNTGKTPRSRQFDPQPPRRNAHIHPKQIPTSIYLGNERDRLSVFLASPPADKCYASDTQCYNGLRQHISDFEPELIVTSPLRRAMMTTGIACQQYNRNIRIVVHPLVREKNHKNKVNPFT